MTRHHRLTLVVATALVLTIGGVCRTPLLPQPVAIEDPLTRAATTYVDLAAALATRDPISGDVEGAAAAGRRGTSDGAPRRLAFAEITAAADEQIAALTRVATGDQASAARHHSLARNLRAISLRAAQLGGRTVTLAEELEGLFGIGDLEVDEAFAPVHAELNRLLPGDGPLARRFARFEERFLVAPEKVPSVFDLALAGCRARTLAHIALPADETVTVTYVLGAEWNAYTRYHGGGHSTIEVSTASRQSVDRLLDLACHEGYPGHHAASVLRDQVGRVRSPHGRLPWPERAILPAFTPDAFAAEAAASQAAALAFADADRLAFERDQLFPAAALPVDDVERYVRVMRLVARLDGAIARVIRQYLAGELDFPDSARALEQDALMRHPQALLMFVNRYRGYALAYASGPAALRRAREAGITEQQLWTRVVTPFTE